LRKPTSGLCQARKTWGKQTLETANAEGNKTSREAHDFQVVLGVGKVAKDSEGDGKL
jgi:hypothetical protein